jgi:hypothetical protein
MKNKKFLTIAVSLAMFLLGTSEVMLSEDGQGQKVMKDDGITGHWGTPNCTECHGGTINSGDGKVVITSPDMPNFKYKPGQQYSIVVTITDSKAKAYGLDFCATDAAKTKLGGLAAGTGTKILTNEITHTAPSTSNVFTFKWTAPASTGSVNANITLNVAALAANKNAASTGDLVYTSTQVITIDNSDVDVVSNPVSAFKIYPNPASGIVNASYSLLKANTVNIKLATLNGQVITELLNEKQDAGQYKKVLELPATVSAGLYLLSIQANDVTSYSKVLITK